VGLWAVNAACREARLWQTLGLGAMTVAVNVSGHQLERADMPRRIARTLQRHSLSPRALEIELTESAAAADIARAGRLFDELRRLGIRIAIDDFGTGFSSLSALRALAFEKIKIDREFVTEVERRRDSQAICQSIIALARGLGIRVLAEGVERQEEYAWLRQHGCTEFQGFYFSPPLAASEFQAFVRSPATLHPLLALGARALQRTLPQRLAQ
jgi:EAL domain-containing protein (putative c-di-GMP-specific phosphodiesterase class I)